MKDTTIVLITFMRPEYTMACVESIRKTSKTIKILVAENGEFNPELKQFVNDHGGRYILMPYDSGVCFARNRLVEMADTEFVLISDDDFYFTKKAQVGKMIRLLKGNDKYSLVGGRIWESGHVLNYQGHINIFPDHFEYIKLDLKNNKKDPKTGLKYQFCDITFNYFVARRKDIIDIKWDEKIKVAYEHSDWFITLKKAGGRKVLFTPDAVVVHKPNHVILNEERNKEYKEFRNRKEDKDYFFAKHSIDYSLGFNGLKTNFREFRTERISKVVTVNKLKYFATKRLSYEGRAYNVGDIIYTNAPADGMSPAY